ncbi:MAG: hypothetical protein J6P31_04675 [Oscillospiraceae bacterium]|nr:hypothetical protein [Oscillospiraceae bacterium]
MEKNKLSAAGIILRIIGAVLAAFAVFVAVSWWQMPYLHGDWYGEDLNMILHIITFALCPVLCVLTFLFAEKNARLCRIGGAAVLVLAAASTLVNAGFVPVTGTLIIGLIAVLYLIAAILSGRPEKPEKRSLEELTRKFRTSRLLAVIFGIASAFCILFPKRTQMFSQHMSEDGPGVIEYYYQYTDFGMVLMVLIPVTLILLTVFLIRAALLHGRIKDLNRP